MKTRLGRAGGMRLLTVAGLLVLAAAGQARQGLDSEGLQRLDAVMGGYAEDGQLVGSVVLVERGGRELVYKAYGLRDRESAVPMEKDTIFRIASMTKAIVSVGVLRLQEEGRLLIEDPVGRYLPEYLQTSVAVAGDDGGFEVAAADRPITIRDLLTHTAGIGYGYGPAAGRWADAGIQGWYFAHRDEPIRETVRRIAALPFDAQPGERFVWPRYTL